MSSQSASVAVVGAGTIFRDHVAAYREIGAKVVGVADVLADRAATIAKQNAIPYHTDDWRKLLENSQTEVIDVCTPPQFHRDVVVAALAAGKHVVCEKPLAGNLADADEMLQTESESAGKLLVVHQLRCSQFCRRLKWLVDKDQLGPIRFARVQRYDPPPADLVAKGAWGGWQLAGGGVLMTKAIHQLDLLLYLLGPAQRVQAMMDTCFSAIESEDLVTANIEFECGTLANVCVSGQAYAGQGQHFDLIGESGSLGQPWHLRLATPEKTRQALAELDHLFPIAGPPVSGWKHLARKVGAKVGVDLFTVRQPNSHTEILRGFLNAIQHGGNVPVTGHDGRQAVELCTAIYAAAITGETVELPLDSSHRFYEGITQHDYSHAAVH
jgi:predicted dehydrogenase